ncbi:MAG: hypothetical protein HRT68_05680, partial [Flavobacteriaceae bacterium]|nr:hypothetical protein [Flavobacteriaceae bacterium]
MHSITDEQVDFIIDDIKAHGVTLDDLQENLLDHICCIIEHEKPENIDFYKFYESILPRFFKRELLEIQEETEKLLTFRHYYAMIKTLKIVGIATVVFTLLGSIFKTFHWPGAGLLIVMGAGLLCLVFLPLMIALKFRDEQKMVDKIVLSFGFLIGMGAAFGILFKLMHWPMAKILMQGSITVFVFAYVPLYYFTRIRSVENKLNTTVNTVLMMACGGLLYALFNLNHNDPSKLSYQQVVRNINQETTVLMSKNEQLFNSINPKQEVVQFHQNSEALHQKLEELKKNLLGEQKSSGLVTIEEELRAYNHHLMNLDLK